jgi:exosortase A
MTLYVPVRPARPAMTARWHTHLGALALLAAATLIAFHGDAADMVSIWLTSSTFNHCALIPPIIGWLVWQRLPELKRLQPAAWFPGLLLVAAGGGAWLLGEAGSVALARHLGLVVMLQGLVVAILGPAVAAGLTFPIFYAVFMVPAGEELVPPMQRLTAELTMALLGVTGVTAHIEGIFISTATGYFEVAEACAGVKFLIAMVALGALVANLCFTSWRRRVAFLAASVVIPVLANGVRAWGTIFVAERTSLDVASSFDHVVYGWFFFAAVMALIFVIFWRFFDRDPSARWLAPGETTALARPSRAVPVSAAAFVLILLWPAWLSATALSGGSEVAALAPVVPGWEQKTAGAQSAWQPRFVGADSLARARYWGTAGVVDVAVAAFASQAEGREIVGFGQGDARGWAWSGSGGQYRGGRIDKLASHGIAREVATFYLVGDRITGSKVEAKIETVKRRLLGGSQHATVVLVSAAAPAEGVSPRGAIDAYLDAAGSPEALAVEAVRVRGH